MKNQQAAFTPLKTGPTLCILRAKLAPKLHSGRLIHIEELCRLTSRGADESTLLIAQIIFFTEAEFASLKASWEKAKFRLRLLEGHNDIVTCVVAVDNLVVSGR